MRRQAFYPRPVVPRFVVDEVALWQVFLPVRRFFPPVNIFPSLLLTLSSKVTLYRGTNGPSLETAQQELYCDWNLGASREREREALFIYVFRGLRKCFESYLTQFQQGCAFDVDNFVLGVLGIKQNAECWGRRHLQHGLLWLLPAAEGVLGIAALTVGIPDTAFPPPVEGGALWRIHF